jgi:HSP20 family protein
MAEAKPNRTDMSTNTGQLQNPRDRQPQRRDASGVLASPFELMERMSDEMDRIFGSWGFPRRSWSNRSLTRSSGRQEIWSPRVEAFQKGDRFIVRADLPGLKKDDIQIELGDEAITIHGERRNEHEEEREGYYHSEREYGSFYRTIPLPDGAIGESAQASFKDGTLEITLQAPPAETRRGRRIEINEGTNEGAQK